MPQEVVMTKGGKATVSGLMTGGLLGLLYLLNRSAILVIDNIPMLPIPSVVLGRIIILVLVWAVMYAIMSIFIKSE